MTQNMCTLTHKKEKPSPEGYPERVSPTQKGKGWLKDTYIYMYPYISTYIYIQKNYLLTKSGEWGLTLSWEVSLGDILMERGKCLSADLLSEEEQLVSGVQWGSICTLAETER